MTYKEFINEILKARGRFGIGADEYYETHHIIPRCVGGEDTINNKIRLYAKEHYEAHRLLALENPNNEKLVYAWWCFVNGWNAEKQQRYIVTPEMYEEAKIKYAEMMSKKNAGEKSVFYGIHKYGEENPHFGKKHSDETKKILSELAKGRKMSQETKVKISKTLKSKNRQAWNKGIKLSKEHKENVLQGLKTIHAMARIPVNQYSLTGEYIKTWESATEAGNFFNIQSAHITDCCNLKRGRCSGFMWRYSSSGSDNIPPYKIPQAKRVAKIDKDTGIIIQTFDSVAIAAQSVGGNAANISMACNPKYTTRTYKGFIWRFVDDENNEEDNDDE